MTAEQFTASADVSTALAELDFIADRWDVLLEARQRGTPRPWRQALIDPDRYARMRDRDREERDERDPDAPGLTSAPQYVDVLDVMLDIWTTLDDVVHTISPDWRRTRSGNAVGRGHEPARLTDIDHMVEFIRTWLPVVGDLPERRAHRLDRDLRRLTRLAEDVSRCIGLVRGGQLLTGAVCPWCRGVTPKHPGGGAITLRVEEISKRQPANGYRPAVEAVHAVVCWNPLCDPPDADCGTRYRGRPAWPWTDWDWLAKRLIVAERTPLPVRPGPDFEIVPIDHSGRSGYAR